MIFPLDDSQNLRVRLQKIVENSRIREESKIITMKLLQFTVEYKIFSELIRRKERKKNGLNFSSHEQRSEINIEVRKAKMEQTIANIGRRSLNRRVKRIEEVREIQGECEKRVERRNEVT
ncbi:hypothetical protein HWI79_2499 [Cryptosporidium felis]|nr:hypothetical protein HWI79_2499 [Cryptosporidium felis]